MLLPLLAEDAFQKAERYGFAVLFFSHSY